MKTMPYTPRQHFYLFMFYLLLHLIFLQSSSLLAANRYSIPLDGTWYFLPCLSDRGEGGRFKYESGDAIRTTWRKIKVPSCWQRQFEDLKYFEGVCWYSRDFQFDSDPELIYAQLVFEGVNYRCRVYLNGQALGDHEGGYTRFTLPAGKALKRGLNTVALRVDNRRHLLKVPGNVGWFNYGGIYRPVRLEVFPKKHIADLAVRTKNLGNEAVVGVVATVEGTLLTENRARKAKISLDILNRDGKKVSSASREILWPGKRESIALDMKIKKNHLQPWSPESPYRYSLRARLALDNGQVDQTTIAFGVRTIIVQGRDLLLNGKPYKLRGICYLYDYLETGRTLDEEVFDRDLADFRELGVNALRNHFPFEQKMLEAFDSLGILVWHDIPVYWVEGYDRYTLILAKDMAREMALAYRNHPSLAVWSLGNENTMAETDRTVFFTALRDELKTHVPDAVTTCALIGAWDVMSKIVDAFSVNIYPGWFDFLSRKPIMWRADSTILEEKLAWQAGEIRRWIDSYPPLPFWISEFGAGSAYGLYPDDRWRLWSENYHALKMEKELAMLAAIPEVSGLFPFCYNDYHDPSRMQAPGQDGKNLMGLVTIDRKRKKAFNVLKEFYKRWGR